jgi:acyl-CoA synthetase (AMP-forming)/AMP-acid ligase II
LFWRGPTLAGLRRRGVSPFEPATTAAADPAAVIFTSGSTGPAKGVLYCHGNFDNQVSQLQAFYGIQPGEIDVPCFPLFGLFNAAMGVTTIIPPIDRRPARVDPHRLMATIEHWQATQSFASPTVWDRVGQYCEQHGLRMPTLRRVLSAGAPVPVTVLQRLHGRIHPEGKFHTPYGATEALPVASIEAGEVLGETTRRTDAGFGVCVGGRFPAIEWRVIRIVDGPILNIDDAVEMPAGEIGELIVRGPVVTERYVTRVEANRLAKIADPNGFWHRMGDVGYLDPRERFWICGRMAHRVLTAAGPMYSIPCEAIFNRHPEVRRAALVGVGPRGQQQPVIIVEPMVGHLPHERIARARFLGQLRSLALSNPLTDGIRHFMVRRRLPVDIRHNAKISRERLAVWAARRMRWNSAMP